MNTPSNRSYESNPTYTPMNQAMPQTPTPSPAGDNQSMLIQLVRELDEVKHTAAQYAQQSTAEVNRLRQQMRWITGLSAVAIVLLGGALVGITMGLRQQNMALRAEQQALAEQIEILQAQQGANPEQLARIEALLDSLNQSTAGLTGQAQRIMENLPNASRDQVQAIQEELEALQENVGENLSEEGGFMDQVNGLFQRVRGWIDGSDEATPEGEGAAGE